MKLQAVDFETVKELKELGFDWKCSNVYDSRQKIDYVPISGYSQKDMDNFLIYAPEQSLVIKWFRDVHKLGIEPGWIGNGYKAVILDVSKPGFLIVVGSDKFKLHPNFEDAELEGIKEAIKYLKNGTNLQK